MYRSKFGTCKQINLQTQTSGTRLVRLFTSPLTADFPPVRPASRHCCSFRKGLLHQLLEREARHEHQGLRCEGVPVTGSLGGCGGAVQRDAVPRHACQALLVPRDRRLRQPARKQERPAAPECPAERWRGPAGAELHRSRPVQRSTAEGRHSRDQQEPGLPARLPAAYALLREDLLHRSTRPEADAGADGHGGQLRSFQHLKPKDLHPAS
uniref:Uncharacterized protein LOC116937182 n=1 Tax=Petromyzon marinus TaxID=7757 RepID=A0AAJ7SKF3_PETMA|nr:uncharacterized protein LOC116937182 [Petromyzon marinus]